MWTLRVLRGAADPPEITIEGEVVLGRGQSADVVLVDARASRRHARIAVRGPELCVEDLGSSAGTLLNGAPVDEAGLAPGDVLRLADVELIVERASSSERRRSVGTDAQVRVERARAGGAELSTPDLLAWITDDARGASALERVASGVAERLRADSVVVLARLLRGGPYRVAAAHPPETDAAPPVSRALLARAEVGHEALLLSSDLPELISRESVAARAAGSALCAPIEHGGDVLGALYAERRRDLEVYTEGDLDVFAGIARAAGPVLAYELATVRREAAETALLTADLDASDRPLLVGASSTYMGVLDIVERVAGLHTTVLLVGDRGTGRKTLARAIHDSASEDAPFVVVPCPELGAQREEALLLGEHSADDHGGDTGRIGLLARARRGTICLAEVDRLSTRGQEALAAALSRRRITPVGGTSEIPLHARVVATAGPTLAQRVAEGSFSQPLYSLLAPIIVHVPSLRTRPEDVGLLARHFAARHGLAARHERMRVADDVVDVLSAYTFPGNVAELSAIIERMVLLAAGDELTLGDVPEDILAAAAHARPRDLTLAEAERAAVARALRAAGGRRGRAAELLGISWPTLTKKVRKYGLDR